MKKNIVLLLTLSITGTLLFTGCGGGSSTDSTPANPTNPITPTSPDNTPPVFKSSSSYNNPEDKRYISYIEAEDESEISYSIDSGVDKDKFSIDNHDGTLIFKNFPDYENPDDLDSDHIYEVTVKATDSSNNEAFQDITIELGDIDESIPKTYDIQQLSNGANSYNVGTSPKSLYILFSNYDTSADSSPSVSHNPKMISAPENKKFSTASLLEQSKILHAPKYVQDFSSKLSTYLSKSVHSKAQAKTISVSERNEDTEGQSETFYLDAHGTQTTTATARKVISNVTTNLGTKTLNIWVSDDSFDSGSGCDKSKCVTQTMVDQLADTFLMRGLNNDIYDWVTNIYEAEWGDDTNGYTGLITANNEITILLTDIDGDDSATGGVIGFFWSKDNFEKGSIGGSNERIMFYVDAVMFANGEDSWDIDDFWPKEMISTLAHEFQHMINFYQKRILLDTDIATWINEMLSETTEDLVATKIKHIGPRGIEYTDGSAGIIGNTNGRYPLFNENNTLSLIAWNNTLADYSKVNAFGTFLIRNYSGAQLLHDIMHNTYANEQAVVDAVNKSASGSGKTFDNLLKEWGISVLLSDRTDATRNQYSYNTNDFTVNEKGETIYKMGAINFFNYDPKPTISTTIGTVKTQGNYYYKVGDNLTGTVDIDLTLNAKTEATLIVK
jgi:hypothetical protein